MRDFAMIDLETLSRKPNALILTVGVVLYNFERGVYAKFERGLDFDSQFKAGRHIEGDTFLWWMRQPEQARASIQQVNSGSTLLEFEDELFDFFAEENKLNPENVYPISYGAAFDIAMLEGALDNCPWHYRNACCWRTWGLEYDDIINWDLHVDGCVRHTALGDARWQAEAHLELMKLVPRVR